MLFWKRRGESGRPAPATPNAALGAGQTFHIDIDMMLKGNFAQRGRRKVRQIGVSVSGVTRVVTSGEYVDRDTYEALLAAGAIRPLEAAARSQSIPSGNEEAN